MVEHRTPLLATALVHQSTLESCVKVSLANMHLYISLLSTILEDYTFEANWTVCVTLYSICIV